MAERFTADLLFIVIALLVAALLGFLIGYYMARGHSGRTIATLEEEKAALEEKVRKLEAELRTAETDKTSLRGDVRRMDDEIASLKLTIDKLEKEERLLAETAAVQAGEAAQPHPAADDLKAVLGIGPKISRLLMNRGINTWKALANATPDSIREILVNDGGERFRVHNPATWPPQARLLHDGRWDELKELRGKLEL
jgi:predicted flap endonuclease-1-like 5' DNA nuclease